MCHFSLFSGRSPVREEAGKRRVQLSCCSRIDRSTQGWANRFQRVAGTEINGRETASRERERKSEEKIEEYYLRENSTAESNRKAR